jgi:GDPmannose 4,6-dehydratase
MKHAIIWGGTGQDGSHLADLLLEKDYGVYAVCRRSSIDNTGRLKHLIDEPNFEIIQGDITDSFSVMNILKSVPHVDEIYNLAAQSHVGLSFTQPGTTWDITGKGCLNVLQSIIDLGINPRFYQASSSEMFGKSFDIVKSYNDVRTNSGVKFQNEDTKFLPQSPYAIAKCAAHYMTRLYREAYGLHASSGILFNHEGPRRGENFVTRKITKWIGEYVRWRLKNSQYPICFSEDDIVVNENFGITCNENCKKRFPKLRLGNLDASRDWGFAGDYVEAMWMMLQEEEPDDYVICTGETHTIREFLDIAFNHVDIDDWSNHVVVDPEFYRPAEVDYLKGDCSKARDRLGWTPKVSFRKLVTTMVGYDCENL